MSKEFMDKMFAWSDSICAPATYFKPLPSPAESLERTKHLMFKAFVSTGWTVWTRYALTNAVNLLMWESSDRT